MTDVHFNEDEPLRFKAEFEVAPDFELGEYRKIEVPYGEPDVSESDVDTRRGRAPKPESRICQRGSAPLQTAITL